MFIWRAFKNLVSLFLLIVAIVFASDYLEYKGKSLRVHVDGFFCSDFYSEGVKDLKTWLAGILKFAGQKMEENILDEEREEVKKVITGDLQERVEQAKGSSKEEASEKNQSPSHSNE